MDPGNNQDPAGVPGAPQAQQRPDAGYAANELLQGLDIWRRLNPAQGPHDVETFTLLRGGVVGQPQVDEMMRKGVKGVGPPALFADHQRVQLTVSSAGVVLQWHQFRDENKARLDDDFGQEDALAKRQRTAARKLTIEYGRGVQVASLSVPEMHQGGADHTAAIMCINSTSAFLKYEGPEDNIDLDAARTVVVFFKLGALGDTPGAVQKAWERLTGSKLPAFHQEQAQPALANQAVKPFEAPAIRRPLLDKAFFPAGARRVTALKKVKGVGAVYAQQIDSALTAAGQADINSWNGIADVVAYLEQQSAISGGKAAKGGLANVRFWFMHGADTDA